MIILSFPTIEGHICYILEILGRTRKSNIMTGTTRLIAKDAE